MLLPNLVNKTSFHEFTLTSNLLANSKHILACCPGGGLRARNIARTRRTPQKKLKGMGQQPESKIFSCPPKYACCKEKRCRATSRACAVLDGSCGSQRALHAAIKGARWQISNEGLLLHPKGAAALLHRKGESLLRLSTRRSLTHLMEGSHCNRRKPAALLHREGKPCLPLSTQRNSDDRQRAYPATEGSRQVCCTGRGAPSDAD